MLYLGTEPPQQTVAFADARPLDYAAMEQERLALLAKLQAAGGAAGLDAAAAAKAEAKAGGGQDTLMLLKASVPSRLDAAGMGSISGSFGDGVGGSMGAGWQQGRQQRLTVSLHLTNTSKSPLQV